MEVSTSNKRKAIECKLLEESKKNPGYYKYLVTIQESDGQVHQEPAYGFDMQDASEQLQASQVRIAESVSTRDDAGRSWEEISPLALAQVREITGSRSHLTWTHGPQLKSIQPHRVVPQDLSLSVLRNRDRLQESIYRFWKLRVVMRVVGEKYDRIGESGLLNKLNWHLVGLHRDITLALEILTWLHLQPWHLKRKFLI